MNFKQFVEGMKDLITVQGVKFSVDGIGSVPLQMNLDYSGFTLWMKPRTFIELALPDTPGRDVSFFVNAIREGKPLAPPWFTLKWEEKSIKRYEWERMPTSNFWSVGGHEGRGRIAAAISEGLTQEIPVHCFGWRWNASSIDQKHIDALREGIVSEDNVDFIKHPASRMVLQDKTIIL
jgi:hypothetical protein